MLGKDAAVDDPTAIWLITSLHERGIKESLAAQLEQIRALGPRFNSWTGTHKGVNGRTVRALMRETRLPLL